MSTHATRRKRLIQKAAKANGINSTYDVVDSDNVKQRRKAKIEIKGEEAQLQKLNRHKIISLARDVERNYTTAKSHLRQFRLNVVGTGPKIHINVDDPAAKEAADWFNEVYQKECDARDDTPFNEICMNILTAAKREGDLVAAFDNFLENDGRLFFYEADQLANIEEKEWERQSDWKGLTQSDGIVYDKHGRIKAYIVCEDRKSGDKKFADCLVLPAFSTAKLLKAPWRVNMRRGTPDIAAALAHYLDTYEMTSCELQTAKLQSKLAGKVKRRNAAEELLFENGIDADAILGTSTSSGDDEENVVAAPKTNYDRYENLTGGFMEYLDDDDDFELLDINRPNVNAQGYIEGITINNGASMGLAQVYSTLKASTSYTAFRGEMLLSWAQFGVDQKWLERRFVDWVARKAINWGIDNRQFSRPPQGWERKLSVSWPVMPDVDPIKTQMAIARSLKNGNTDFQRLLGPNWRSILENFAEQVKLIRALELPLDLLETKSGAASAPEKSTGEDNAEGQEENNRKVTLLAKLWNKIKGDSL
jgi:capsid protein